MATEGLLRFARCQHRPDAAATIGGKLLLPCFGKIPNVTHLLAAVFGLHVGVVEAMLELSLRARGSPNQNLGRVREVSTRKIRTGVRLVPSHGVENLVTE